jgi:hypothetical protein
MRPSINFTAVLRVITTNTQRSSELLGRLFRRVAPRQRHTTEMFIDRLCEGKRASVQASNIGAKRRRCCGVHALVIEMSSKCRRRLFASPPHCGSTQERSALLKALMGRRCLVHTTQPAFEVREFAVSRWLDALCRYDIAAWVRLSAGPLALSRTGRIEFAWAVRAIRADGTCRLRIGYGWHRPAQEEQHC